MSGNRIKYLLGIDGGGTRTTAAVSDENGNYSISASPGQELQFSFLGFKTETVKVGDQSVINLVMKSDAQVMQSSVVTALGIKRDEKSIGYSAQKVESDKFANSGTTGNWLNGLSGQVVNSHRAVDDVLATVAVMEEMEKEKNDLMCYVNLFGYNPKYGIDGKPIGSVTYKPQPYDPKKPLYEL